MACRGISMAKTIRSINGNGVRNYSQNDKGSIAEVSQNVQNQVQVAQYGYGHDHGLYKSKSSCGSNCGKRGSMCSICYKKNKYGERHEHGCDAGYNRYGYSNPCHGSHY